MSPSIVEVLQSDETVSALRFEAVRLRLDCLLEFVAMCLDEYHMQVEDKHYSVVGPRLGCAVCGSLEGSGSTGRLRACEGCMAVFYCSEW